MGIICKNLLSIGSPLMNQRMVGRGAPSERHTKRPFSSGAKIKSAGFSNQNGAAFKYEHVSRLNIMVQSENYWGLLKVRLTFDPDSYRVLNVADLVGSRAHVFASIFKRRLRDLNQLVEVLHFHARRHRQALAVLGPGNMGSRPWWWETRLYGGRLTCNQTENRTGHKKSGRVPLEWQWIYITIKKKKFYNVHTHTPAAIHSRSSSSPCRTTMELDEPVGDSQVGAASATVRAGGGTQRAGQAYPTKPGGRRCRLTQV